MTAPRNRRALDETISMAELMARDYREGDTTEREADIARHNAVVALELYLESLKRGSQ